MGVAGSCNSFILHCSELMINPESCLQNMKVNKPYFGVVNSFWEKSFIVFIPLILHFCSIGYKNHLAHKG